MLNLRESKRSAQIELTRREIEVALGSAESTSLILVYPPINELEDIRDSYSPKITLREAMQQDPFGLKEIYSFSLKSLKTQQTRFEKSSTFLNQLANLSSLTDDEEQARKYLKSAADLDDQAFFAAQIARSYVSEGNLAAAADCLDDPDLGNTVDLNILSAKLALAHQDTEQASVFIDKALTIDPIDPTANIIKGGICLIKGEPHLAIHYFRTAIQESQVSSDVYVNLAVCHYLLGHRQKALRNLMNAIYVNPTNENAVIFYSDLLFELNERGNDITPLSTLVTFDSKSEVAWNRLARSFYVNARFTQALDALKHEAALTENPAVWNNIAVVHWRNNNYSKSEKYYNYAIKLASDDLDKYGQTAFGVLKNLASHYLSLNQFDHAIKTAKNAISLAKENHLDDSAIAASLITATLRTSGVDSATEAARTFLDREDLDTNTRVEIIARLIGIHGEYGSPEEDVAPFFAMAASCLGSETQLSDQVVFRLNNNLMFTLLQLDKLDEAESISRRLTDFIHRDPFITATFGLLHLKKGRIEKGTDLYRSAIGIARDRSLKDQIRQRLNLELGRLYLRLGDEKKAIPSLERARSEKLGYDYVAELARGLIQSLQKPRM